MDEMKKRCERCGQYCILHDTVWDDEEKVAKRLFICQCGQRFTVVRSDQARRDRGSDTLETLEGVNRKLEELGLDEQ